MHQISNEEKENVEEDYMDDEINPLLYPVVLEFVFEHCPPSTWASCRLVCKTWYTELLTRWRDQMIVRLFDASADHTGRPSNYLTVQDYIINYQLDTFDPFKYAEKPLRNIITQNSFPIMCSHTHTFFWGLCGHWLKILKLKDACIADVLQLKELIFSYTPNVELLEYSCCFLDSGVDMDNEVESNADVEYNTPPEIQQLQLKSLTIDEHHGGQGVYKYPISWLNTFSAFPNLDVLTLSHLNKETAKTSFEKIIAVIGSMRTVHNNQVLKIKELNIKDIAFNCEPNVCLFTVETINKFNLLSLPLVTMELDLRIGVNAQGLTRLLDRHQNTLRNLLLKRDTNCEPFTEFPYAILPINLKTLTLEGSVFPIWDFLAYTPNLEVLNVNDYGCDVMAFSNDMKENGKPLVALESFKYESSELVDKDAMQTMGKLTPNLKQLEVSSVDGGFEAICKAWFESLQSLTIIAGEVSEKCFILNIPSLQELKTLEMNNNWTVPQYRHKSIYKGILKLPKLEKLSARFSKNIKMEAMTELQNKIADTTHVRVGDEYLIHNKSGLDQRAIDTLNLDRQIGLQEDPDSGLSYSESDDDF